SRAVARPSSSSSRPHSRWRGATSPGPSRAAQIRAVSRARRTAGVISGSISNLQGGANSFLTVFPTPPPDPLLRFGEGRRRGILVLLPVLGGEGFEFIWVRQLAWLCQAVKSTAPAPGAAPRPCFATVPFQGAMSRSRSMLTETPQGGVERMILASP